MNGNRKTLACLLFALGVPALALAQSQLILPQNQDDIRKLTKNADAGPCDRCGVVTNVRSENRAPQQQRKPSAPPPASGVSSNLAPTPLISSGSAVKDARRANTPNTFYKLTVRLDDGTYAFYDQDDKPVVRKGDKIRVVDGRVEPR